MKTYYCVTSQIFDNGACKAFLTTVNADKMPEGSYKATTRYDLYVDYFDSKRAAQDFLKTCR